MDSKLKELIWKSPFALIVKYSRCENGWKDVKFILDMNEIC